MELAHKIIEISELTSVLIAIYDQESRLQYANPAFRDAYSLKPGEKILWSDIMRRNLQTGAGTPIRSDDLEGWLAGVISRRGKEVDRVFESDLTDGRWLRITETHLPDGWSLFVGVDITNLRIDERELLFAREQAIRHANTDELTGISNRRHIMDLLRKVLRGEHSSRVSTGGVCLFDLDYFKRINDLHGHGIGDMVLVHFAHTVRATIRLQDCLGRVGGEEFMLVLPGATLEQTKATVGRILRDVRKARPVPQNPSLQYTCSVGVTDIRAGDTIELLYARADAALYESKHSGRDRFTVAA